MSDADAGVYYTPQAALDAVTDKPDLNAIMANPPFRVEGHNAPLYAANLSAAGQRGGCMAYALAALAVAAFLTVPTIIILVVAALCRR